jgi:hypothetical protein
METTPTLHHLIVELDYPIDVSTFTFPKNRVILLNLEKCTIT